MTERKPPEKRRFRRIAVALTAHCRIGNRFIRDAVANLSIGGLFLKTKERAQEGTPVRVALALPEPDGIHFCTLVGKVARIERDRHGWASGLGVSFAEDQIAPPDKNALEHYVGEKLPSNKAGPNNAQGSR